jgi:hypothetical protein
MAAAEKQTAPGPGKQRMHDSLAENEKKGFAAAVEFSLERNRNAQRAATGAKITSADAGILAARNAEKSAFYRLGFDIATAIFGDPASGAQGATLTGPGSLRVRNGLSPAGQKGFDAGLKFNFGRRNLSGNLPKSPVETKEGHFGRGGATSRAAEAFQPENTIRVNVRYKKEFGYVGDTNAFGYVGPTSCSAFLVSALGDPLAGQTNPIRIGSDFKMESAGDYYICTYLVSFVPLNQPIRVSVSLTGANGNAAWKGGSHVQPAPGQRRTIIIVSGRGGDPVTLTAAQPRAIQIFEMIYTSQPR